MGTRRTVRTAARALIVRQRRLLTIKMRDRSGLYYLLPGGGQVAGETMPQTVRRECLEEIGCEVEVGEMIYLREYIGRNHSFAYAHRNFHQLEAVFRCRLRQPEAVCCGPNQDNKQVGIAWLDLDDIGHYRVFPSFLRDSFEDDEIRVARPYLGDVN